MSRVKRSLLRALPGRFLDLVRLYPPHAIENESDYDDTLEVLEALLRLRRPTQGQAHYLETLTQLVEAYDALHYTDDLKGLSPVEALGTLLASHQMTASDLGRLLGSRSLGSKLLRGERDLSQAHIRKLSKHFAVDPSLFFGR